MIEQGAIPKDKRRSGKWNSGNRSRRGAYIRHLSIGLYDVLDKIGASQMIRKLQQACSLSWEIIHTIALRLDQQPDTCFIAGSKCEGTTTPGLNSDLDHLYMNNYVPVVESINNAGDGNSYLMIRDKYTQPGYVKLQHLYNGQSQTVKTRDINHTKEESDSEGRICAKHMSAIGLNKDVNERHGPADRNTQQNIDYVHAFRCLKIPRFANEWIGRQRKYKWPTIHMIDKMATMGCVFVGVGHPNSNDTNIEWRLSFSLQERELMFNFNPVQHKCYVVLKMIKNTYLEPKVGKAICSYHIKTCMFYVIENTRPNIWKRQYLIQCVRLCMFVLLKWVYIGNCPNFFMKAENLFEKDIHKRQRLNLIKLMRLLLSDGCGFLLFLIKLDRVGILLKNVSNIAQINSSSDYSKVVFNMKVKLLDCILVFRKTLYDQAKTNNDTINLILTYLLKTKSMNEHTEQQTQQALSYIISFVHLYLAQSYISLAFNECNLDCKRVLLQGYLSFLQAGYHGNHITSRLLEATVFYKLKQYEQCIDILDQLEVFIKKEQKLSLCSCYLQHDVYFTKEHVRKLSTLSVNSIKRSTSTCMIFRRSDMSIIPKALQYEMFRSIDTLSGSRHKHLDAWFDMAVVDAPVYLHFMQYLAHKKLNRILAVNKLELIVEQDKHLGHRETGYNLLGWIHFRENWIKRGLKYLRKSWEIRPIHNAAKLHMMEFCRDKMY